jgi:hypothetical protein
MLELGRFSSCVQCDMTVVQTSLIARAAFDFKHSLSCVMSLSSKRVDQFSYCVFSGTKVNKIISFQYHYFHGKVRSVDDYNAGFIRHCVL